MDYIEHVTRAMRGDLKSYEYLVNEFQGMTISYAYSVLHDFHLAEDASQEAFILLFRNIHNIKQPAAFITWLRKLVFTCCNRILRKKNLEVLVDEIGIDNMEDPNNSAEQSEMTVLVHQSLSKLSKSQQEVFLLYYSFGKSYAEIAMDLEITESAVSNRLYAGKEKLKNIMLSTMTDYLGGYVVNKAFTSKVIENIRKLYAIPSENYMFDACMCSTMIHLNGNEAFDYLFFAGVTGDIFTQVWLEPKWQYNDSFSHVAKYTEIPMKAAFDSCGYEYEFIDKETIQRKQKECVNKIVDSINKGIPVLTFGIVGPPICSIICGYDENGEVLIGWSQFTDEPKEDNPSDLVTSTGQFRKRNGLLNSEALIFFKKKKDMVSLNESIRKSIFNIPNCASREKTDILVTGQTAYFGMEAFDMWADSLMCDEFFTDEESLERPLDTYGSCIVMVGTNMHYIQEYLGSALKLCPDMKDQIEKLQQAYKNENDALQRLVEFQGGYFFDSDRKALLNKDFRIKLADHIRDVGKYYMDASNLLTGK